MNEIIIAAIRRAAASAVGSALVWLAATLHIVISSATSAEVIGLAVAVAVAGYGWVAQQIEKRYPAIGRALFLGAGRRVTYEKH